MYNVIYLGMFRLTNMRISGYIRELSLTIFCVVCVYCLEFVYCVVGVWYV